MHSVPTAIASFALTPDSFEETIGNVILLGGDTDTLAAMAGSMGTQAVSGRVGWSGWCSGTGQVPMTVGSAVASLGA